MKKNWIVIIMLFGLTSCDYLNSLKFKYYYQNKGEMLCSGNMEDGKEFQMHFTKINTDFPFLELNNKITKYSKIIENDAILNIQNINYETGASSVILLDKKKGQMISVWVGVENENLITHKLLSNCK
jgi:hypothetical protein